MILLKYKPVLLNHFESDRLYDIGNQVYRKNSSSISTDQAKFGSNCMHFKGIENYPGSKWKLFRLFCRCEI